MTEVVVVKCYFETFLSKTRSSGTVTCDGSPDDSSDSSTIRAEDVLDMPFIVRLWLQKADQVGTDQGIIRKFRIMLFRVRTFLNSLFFITFSNLKRFRMYCDYSR